MEMGAGFPGAFVSTQRMQDAALSRQEKSLVLASTQSSPTITDVAAATRRLFGSCKAAARQDILIEENADAPLGSGRE